jgi:hypothetical protein
MAVSGASGAPPSGISGDSGGRTRRRTIAFLGDLRGADRSSSRIVENTVIGYTTAEGGHAMRHLLAAALAVMLALSAAP